MGKNSIIIAPTSWVKSQSVSRRTYCDSWTGAFAARLGVACFSGVFPTFNATIPDSPFPRTTGQPRRDFVNRSDPNAPQRKLKRMADQSAICSSAAASMQSRLEIRVSPQTQAGLQSRRLHAYLRGLSFGPSPAPVSAVPSIIFRVGFWGLRWATHGHLCLALPAAANSWPKPRPCNGVLRRTARRSGLLRWMSW